jgi:hypothetical protein
MKCRCCGDFAETTKNDDGTYEAWCDCGYHEVLEEEEA